MSKTSKKLQRLQRQEGLLQEFSHQEQDHYEERKVGTEWFVKQWNGGTERWQVSIFTEDSFRRYKGFQYNENKTEFEHSLNKED